MRKAQKKEAEDFLELLGQAHEEIKKAIEKKNIPAALSLLADCQEGAISLGELIEKTEGEDAAVIPFLEKYCEAVYLFHEEIAGKTSAGENIDNGYKIYKKLRQFYFQIKSCVSEIKVRIEAVFLPYKASMWDSLESVWKAADADPDCDAYVIPIPYYDRLPDGSFGERHYEVGQYPADVPVVWYEEYDFEKRRPDMIFIHNPYDDCNFVTSVHPFFYSENLKKYTDKLVYIPYFVLEEIDPENKAATDGIKHFCTAPAVFHADKVIVQSEKMRQTYINVLTETTEGENSARQREIRKYWEDKIDGTGSPKFDKVLGTKKEELEIPEEWMKIIRKSDGSFKKIILYNTSVGALLQHGEKMIEKIKDVFQVFRDAKEEIALLWRPHPLIKTTIETMRPWLWEKYEEIVRRYQEESWGIYDDTADMNRAVALSDAYYGDASSLVQLYQETGKPVMIQDVDVREYQKNR